ncbi:MAG: peptide deformylase [Spirochaetia bacterium]|nr:peptide deformylase [Spirochaetia bacterium]
MILEIRKYPDPVLKKKSAPVDDFGARLKQLCDDMLETMYANNGVGLAANQVGVPIQVITIDVSTEKEQHVYRLINPILVETSREKNEYEEGCLSFPGITEKIYRPAKVKVRAQDTDGRVIFVEGEGLLATALQHEMDHLNGVVFVDRMSPVRKTLHNRELKELKEDYKKEHHK